jgi:predicted aminopeptidase
MIRRVRIWGAYIFATLTLTAGVAWFSSHDLRYAASAALDHLRLMAARRPIEYVVDLPETPSDVREKLRFVTRARRFASDTLRLPDNGSYTTYVDIRRPEVAWNVFAVPELSIRALEWCFPVVGCVVYRGYSSEPEARAFASGLSDDGHDTYVSRVTAYSTLGWFDDPVLSTFIDRSAEDLAATIFHELAHQQLYVTGDSSFNESFASTVEREGMRRWLGSQGQKETLERVSKTWGEREARVRLILATRAELGLLFASEAPVEEKRRRKRELLNQLEQALCEIDDDCEGRRTARSAGGQIKAINNAYLVAVGTYNTHIPAFEAMLAETDGVLTRFYEMAEELGKLPPEERTARLDGSAGGS